MNLWKKCTAAWLACCAAVLCTVTPVYAESGTSAAVTEQAESQEETQEETQAATEPEQITSGDYTYYVDEELGGAVISAYPTATGDVVIPDTVDGQTVVGLGDYLFDELSSVKTVALPDSLSYIGRSVFYGASVEQFILSDKNETFMLDEQGVLYSKDGTVLYAFPTGSKLEKYTVPVGVLELYHGCFAQAGNLHELELPDGLLHIDSWAFAYSDIASLSMPDTVLDTGSYACAYMKRIEEVHLSENLDLIGAACFAGCAQLKSVKIPKSVTQILQGAFAGTGMKYVAIPSTVTTIGYCAFGYQTNMEKKKSNFVIYGVSGSAAQTYAKDTDLEYDYKNDFTFVPKTDAEIEAGVKPASADSERPEALAGETPSYADENSAADSDTAISADTDKEDNNNFGFIMKIALFVLGGIVLVGGVLAIVLSSRKDKKQTAVSPAEPESETESAGESADEN